jgi:hypothetical protein
MAFIRACIDSCGHSVGLRLGVYVYTRERDNDGGIYIVYGDGLCCSERKRTKTHTFQYVYVYIINYFV